MYQLKYIPTDPIYLVGSSFEIQVDQAEESLCIFMDGGFNDSKDVVYFEIRFHPAASLYYEINQMWQDTLKERYDLSEMEKHRWVSGIYQVKDFDSPKIKVFDPKNSLNLVKFLVISQYGFCEVIAKENFEIKQYQSQISP